MNNNLENLINKSKDSKGSLVEIESTVCYLGADRLAFYETTGKDSKGKKIKSEKQSGWNYIFSELGSSRPVWFRTPFNDEFLKNLEVGGVYTLKGFGYDIKFGAKMIQEQPKVWKIGRMFYEK